ncbi:hypothetical protein B5G34_00560 [Flavonifractor sp. An82]|uniref:hypothetical protein n=1 Tax=Flavonifractor sp. An82 TaxID=1965660 RepID=UPI000B364EC4|nr:hypothetical protein [Flavonifractor sp. An82]OUN23625.1 hypothetical protein B5G34_00560 [Flavonifractor sp. An82]
MAHNHNSYTSNYTKENYDQVLFKIPKGKKELLKQEAEIRDIRDSQGKLSVSRMIVLALEKQYGLDLHTKE